MTATDELRRLLDERGVKWMPSAFDPPHETFYKVNGVGFIVTEFPEIQRMSLSCDMRITPEQAIEATLGTGTCRIDVFDNLMESEGAGDVWLECSRCHWKMDYAEAPSMPLNYCPNCGARVVSGDGEE